MLKSEQHDGGLGNVRKAIGGDRLHITRLKETVNTRTGSQVFTRKSDRFGDGVKTTNISSSTMVAQLVK
jgi:hypothetical protein